MQDYWWRERHTGEQDKTENPEIGPHNYGRLVFDKGAKAVQWRKDSLSYTGCWHSGALTGQK